MAYKTVCVRCNGHNFYVTEENGLKYCFNCGYIEREGEIKPPVRYHDIVAIRQLYTELTCYYHSCLMPAHEQIMIARGITCDQINQHKIGYVPLDRHVLYQQEIALHAGITIDNKLPFLADRIVFPYFVENIVTDIRGRTIINHPIKYLSCKGSGYYRGADYPYNYAALQNDIVVITEGEIKALASIQVGIPAIGLPGILSLRPQIKQSENQTFVVCFDSQRDMSDVYRAIHRIGERFNKVKVATLPLQNEKQDIDGYILQYGADAYRRVISRVLPFEIWKTLIRL